MSFVQLSYLVEQFFTLARSKLDVLDVLTARALLRCVVITEVRLDSVRAEQGERQERTWQPRHRQTDRETDTQSNGSTGRQLNRDTHRETRADRDVDRRYHQGLSYYIHNVQLVADFALLRLHAVIAAAAAAVCSRCSWYEPHSIISSPLLH